MLMLYGATQAEGVDTGYRQTIAPSKRADRARPVARHHHAGHALARHRVQIGLAPSTVHEETETSPTGSDARERLNDGADSVAWSIN